MIHFSHLNEWKQIWMHFHNNRNWNFHRLFSVHISGIYRHLTTGVPIRFNCQVSTMYKWNKVKSMIQIHPYRILSCSTASSRSGSIYPAPAGPSDPPPQTDRTSCGGPHLSVPRMLCWLWQTYRVPWDHPEINKEGKKQRWTIKLNRQTDKQKDKQANGQTSKKANTLSDERSCVLRFLS